MQEKKEGAQQKIRQIFHSKKEVYGSPRICRELAKEGLILSQKTVANYMREMGLTAIVPLKFTITTQSNHEHKIYPNLLNRDFHTDLPNTVWVADITYIWTREGWLYLATVMDLFSRKIVGFNMGSSLTTELPKLALERALRQRAPEAGLIHHSDQGVQYASKAYVELLTAHHCRISMSRRGDCFDNACIEAFHASLKKELVYRTEFQTREEAERVLSDYIMSFYNDRRSHSTLGYLSPNEFEDAHKMTK